MAPPVALPVCLVILALVSLLVLTFGERMMDLLSGHCHRRDDDLTGLLSRQAFLDEASKVVDMVVAGPGPAGTAPRAAGADGPAGAAATTGGQGWEGCTRRSQGAAFLLVGLDRFREVNHTLGHDEGDRLLRGVGQRLHMTLRDEDLLGRLHGDNFAVVIADADADGAQRAAQRLRAALQAPLQVGGMPVPATASVGIALAPTHGNTAKDLLARAEEAMYEAKRECSGQRLFDGGCQQSSRDRLRLRAELASVFEEGQLELRYQPKANLRTGQVTGVEALARWRHPSDGVRPPGVFLPEMERAGLMRTLTEQVIDLALSDHARWRAAGVMLPVSVNVPASVIVQEDVVDVVRGALARHWLPPDALTVEVTEDSVISSRERARRVMAGLRAAGVRVSLDDFGTGLCSLAYLRELPADELKLDRSFLGDIEHSASAVEIVRRTVGLAHALDLTIVAEGVESETSWDALAGWGCDEAQGYFVSQPLEGDRVLEWLYGWWQQIHGTPDAPVPEEPAEVAGGIVALPPADVPGGMDGDTPDGHASELDGHGDADDRVLAALTTPGMMPAVQHGPPGHPSLPGYHAAAAHHGPPGHPGPPGQAGHHGSSSQSSNNAQQGHNVHPLWLVGFRASQRLDASGCRPGVTRGRSTRQLSTP
jgi:diguanylate cyclase (GGDEF)-like protein